MKIAWMTDIHLNFVDLIVAHNLCLQLAEAKPDAILLGGDIAEAPSLCSWLEYLGDELGLPIYFVLGNHDFYRGSIAGIRREMDELDHAHLHWLPKRGVVSLNDKLALVGHGGWYDARLGDGEYSKIQLNDFSLIEELREVMKREGFSRAEYVTIGADRKALGEKLRALGDEAAESLRPHLYAALGSRERVIVLTHVPPFREASWHEGEISSDPFLPFFTSKAMGDLLIEAADAHPERKITLLCGHTHGGGEARIRENLHAYTGPAEYGKPEFHIIEPFA